MAGAYGNFTGGGGSGAVVSDATLSGTGVAGTPLHVANPFTGADETKLDDVEALAQKNVHVAAANMSMGSAPLASTEFVPYTDRAAASPIRASDDLDWGIVQRVKLHRRSSDIDPSSPLSDLDAVDNDAFFRRAVKEGMFEALIRRYTSAFTLDAATDDTVVLEPIAYQSDVIDCYCYFVRGDLGALTNADSGGHRMGFRLPARHYPVPGLRRALAVSPTEAARIQSFLDDPQTERLTGWTMIDPNSGTYTGADGQIIATEGTGDPAPLYIVVAWNDGDGAAHKTDLSLAAGDELLIEVGGAYLFGTATAQGANGSPATGWRWTYALDSERGEDAYDALPAGAATIYLRKALAREFAKIDLSNADIRGLALRPDGDLASDDVIWIVTASGGVYRTTFAELFEFHDTHHSGTARLPGYTSEVTSLTGDSSAGLVNDDGNNLNITPLTNADKKIIKATLIAGKKIALAVSDDRYTEYTTTSAVGEQLGVLAVQYTGKTVSGAAIGDGVALTLVVQSNIAARGEFRGFAFAGGPKVKRADLEGAGFSGAGIKAFVLAAGGGVSERYVLADSAAPFPGPPAPAGTYKLRVVRTSQGVTYSWADDA